MAIYHLSVKAISRAAGRSATAAAAYRAGCQIADERTGEIHDYTRKGGVLSADLVLPAGAPEWASDRSALWNAAELSEKRKDACVAREIVVALPEELFAKSRRRLVLAFAKDMADQEGCAVDVAIHAPNRNGDERNHHAHILRSTRKLDAAGFGDKLDTEKAGRKRKDDLEATRARWAEMVNEALERDGHIVQIDHRSLKAQGIDRAPTRHLGPSATGYERRTGQASRRRLDWDKDVAERLAAAKEQGELSRQLASIEQSLLDLSGDLERAKAERSQQTPDRYGLKAAAQAAEALKTPAPADPKPAKPLSIATLYGIGAVPQPQERPEVAQVPQKPAPTEEQAMPEPGWGVKIAGLKPVPEQQRGHPLRDQPIDPETLKRAAEAQCDTARFVPNQGWVPVGKTQEEEAAERARSARRLIELQRLEAEQQNAARQRDSDLERQYAQHLAQIKRSYLDWLVAKHSAKLEQAEREQRDHLAKKPLVIGLRAWEEQHRLKGFAVERAATDQRDAIRHQNNPNLTGPFVYGEQRPDDYAAQAMRERHPALTQEVERIKSERRAQARAEEQRIWKTNLERQLAEHEKAPKRGPRR